MEPVKFVFSERSTIKMPIISKKRPMSLLSIKSSIILTKYPKKFSRLTSFGNYYDNIYSGKQKSLKNDEDLVLEDYNIEEKLKCSVCVYSDYQRMVNPEKNYVNALCPITLSRKSIINNLKSTSTPKKNYDKYKIDTMRVFCKAEFRIKKIKRSIELAKQLSYKIIS